MNPGAEPEDIKTTLASLPGGGMRNISQAEAKESAHLFTAPGLTKEISKSQLGRAERGLAGASGAVTEQGDIGVPSTGLAGYLKKVEDLKATDPTEAAKRARHVTKPERTRTRRESDRVRREQPNRSPRNISSTRLQKPWRCIIKQEMLNGTLSRRIYRIESKRLKE
jgi:hypothetical protein